jgi:hypothetical protein
MKVWCFDPQAGGVKISPDKFQSIVDQAVAHEREQAWYPKFKLKIRFKGQFCYLDAFENGEEASPIGRLRHFADKRWSLAFYAYSTMSYQPCVFSNGEWFGTLEDAIDICSVYLTN